MHHAPHSIKTLKMFRLTTSSSSFSQFLWLGYGKFCLRFLLSTCTSISCFYVSTPLTYFVYYDSNPLVFLSVIFLNTFLFLYSPIYSTPIYLSTTILRFWVFNKWNCNTVNTKHTKSGAKATAAPPLPRPRPRTRPGMGGTVAGAGSGIIDGVRTPRRTQRGGSFEFLGARMASFITTICM